MLFSVLTVSSEFKEQTSGQQNFSWQELMQPKISHLSRVHQDKI